MNGDIINKIDDGTNDKLTFVSLFILCSLFIFGLQIKTISSLMLPAAFVVSLFMKGLNIRMKLVIDVALVFLFCFIYYGIMISYRLAVLDKEMILITVNFCIAYYLGAILSHTYKNVHVTIIIVISGFVIFSNLSVYKNILMDGNTFGSGSIVLDNRNVPSIWSSDESQRISATGLGLYLSLGITLITSLFDRMNRYWKVYGVTISLFSIFATLAIQSRTPLLTGIITILIVVALFLGHSFITQEGLIKRIFIFGCIILGITIFANQIIEYIVSSPLFRRQVEMGVEDVRYSVWLEGLRGLIEFPMGGQKSQSISASFYHNLWLDIGWYGGIIPVLILLMIQIKHMKPFAQAIFKQKNYIVLGTLMSFSTGMMLEPIMQGYNYYFILSFFILGYIRYSMNQTDVKEWEWADGAQKSTHYML
ncbi:hypothetical protein [Paenibacillus terrigena]|uniref:hypothetical protein n=1 Tax=Paenibacillus terrigena TaxID=369333 RepID=UPI0003752B6E|nr:hypothetical protein [Paenibacillus terrigena]